MSIAAKKMPTICTAAHKKDSKYWKSEQTLQTSKDGFQTSLLPKFNILDRFIFSIILSLKLLKLD